MQVGVAITLNFAQLAGLHFWKALVHTVNTFLINSGTCMQICKHAHRTITLSECNVAVSITVAVSYNTEDQSPACTSFCSLACLSGTACCHGVSGMACSFGLHTKPAAVGSILLPLTTDIPLNHPWTYSWTMLKHISEKTVSSGLLLCLLTPNMTLL